MNEIVEKVAYDLLLQENILDLNHTESYPYSSLKKRDYFASPKRNKIIHVEVSDIKIGSLFEKFTIMIPAVLANPNVIAVLQGITANIIFSIANSKISTVMKKNGSVTFKNQSPPNGPLDIGPNVREVMLALASSPQPNGAEFTVKTAPDGGQEITLKIPPSKN